MARSELYTFNGADWEYEYSAMMRNQQPGETYPSLTPFYLIDHPEGTVLIDTGTSYELLDHPEEYGPYGTGYFTEFAADEIEMSEDQKAVNQVVDLGYAPTEIDYVVMTHLHLDHTGDIREFPESEFIVQQDELEYAWWPADPIQRKLYVEGDFGVFHSSEYSVRAIDGYYDVFGDGSIECIPTPGHSPGHQAVKVELEDTGTVILAADLAFIQEAYETELQPAFAWDTEHAIRSNRKIRNLERKEDAAVYLAHDREHFDELPTPPESLE